MSFFDEVAFPWVLGTEGGYQNDPRDKGNWTGGAVGVGQLRGTKFGISAASYPYLDIKNLTTADALSIAKRDFWDMFQGDNIPPAVALCVFDFGYNAGVHEAVKTLQRVLGVAEDGVVGPNTIRACSSYDASFLCQKYTGQRIEAYKMMPEWQEYGDEWITRATKTLAKAGTYLGSKSFS